jgi:hypothetical protein
MNSSCYSNSFYYQYGIPSSFISSDQLIRLVHRVLLLLRRHLLLSLLHIKQPHIVLDPIDYVRTARVPPHISLTGGNERSAGTFSFKKIELLLNVNLI